MSELLPCPFCGGEAVFHDSLRPPETYPCRVYCDNCWAEVGGYSTEAEAITAWNSRAERTCKPLGTIRYDYEGGYAGFEYETELSCGHKWRDAYGDYPDYCPYCGCKVVGE